MSMINNHQMIGYLYRQGISQAMIKILEEQRINDEDLQTIDRDDIDHLFKNELGFTFRDRKIFWNAILKFRSIGVQNDVIYIEQPNETSNIYNMMNNEPLNNYQPTSHYVPIVSSNVPTSVRIYDASNPMVNDNILELSSSEEDHDDNAQTATTSLPAHSQSVRTPRLKKSSDSHLKYSYELPVFSSKVMRALGTNGIQNEWSTFINELALWIRRLKPMPTSKSEFQEIGQTIFKHYPCIARDGFRPWSYMCRCLTQKLRRMRKKPTENQIKIS